MPPGRNLLDRQIVSLALPALGALAADPLVSMVDTAFVGRLGTVPLGALGVAAAVFAVAFFLFNFLAYGTTPLVARAVGAGDRDAAGRMVVTALLLAAGLGVLTTVILEIAADPIVRLMGAGDALVDPATTYLRIRAIAVPAALVVLAGHGAFRGYQDTRTPLWVGVGLNAVNLVLDPILIFGAGLGIAGAAWATVVAQFVGALWFCWLLLVSRREQLGITGLGGAADVRRLAAAGRHLVVRSGALLAALTLATATAARVGNVAVAAHQVAIQVWIFLALVVDALAVAAQAIVARDLGRGDERAARRASTRLLQWGLLGGVLLAILIASLYGILPRLFTDESPVVEAVSGVYLFLVLMQPLNALVFVWDGIVMGAADFRFLAWAMVFSALTAGVVLVMVVPLGWGLTGVWWGIALLMLVRGGTLGWWHWSSRAPGRRAQTVG